MLLSIRKTALVACAVMIGLAVGTAAQDAPGAGLVMYMQMGGNPGDGATLARQTGAAEAASALGVDLREQFSAWAPETMINHFKEAVAARPDCVAIMGHPGSTAFYDIVAQAVQQGIVVTVGNSPMTDLQAEFGSSGMGYAGVDLYEGGKLTAQHMLAQGLRAGDQAMVYGVFSQAERGLSEKGLADTLEAAGLVVDRLEITQEANSDASLAVPVLAAYIAANPDLKARSAPNTAASPASSPRRCGRRASGPAKSSSAGSIWRRRPSTASSPATCPQPSINCSICRGSCRSCSAS